MKTNAHRRSFQITLATITFMLCSSTMLIVNKLAISRCQAPGVLLVLQLLSSCLSVLALSAVRIVKLDGFSIAVAKPYSVVALAFLAALYSNAKTLQYANVETFIVFRTSTPILISVLDYIFLGRTLPGARSSFALLGMLVAAVLYVLEDSHFKVSGYTWVGIWYLVFCFDQIFIKYVVDNVQLAVWGRVLYSNALAAPPAIMIALVSGEWDSIVLNARANAMVVLSCILGVAMSFASFNLRGSVSATSFTVIGTSCKILSVYINYFVFDEHASFMGLLYLGLCMGCALIYQPAGRKA